jgi:molybdopterin-guanine dinucleotide biosynthesis protein A
VENRYPKERITGVILAGGRARRMGGADKGLITLNGKPMVEYTLHSLRSQVAMLMIIANRNLEAYQALGQCPVIADVVGDFAGPLAGMATGMQAARTEFILTVPCDSPFVTPHLAYCLFSALERQGARLSVATDGYRIQPVFALLPCDLVSDVKAFLNAGERKIDRWYKRHPTALANLADHADTFLNINSQEELNLIETKLKRSHHVEKR